MDKHVTLLGVVLIAAGALGLLAAAIVFWAVAGGALFSGDMTAIATTTTIAGLIGGLIAVLSIPEIIAGIGLLKKQNWARIMALILSVINLLEIPIGTVIGIYGLWVLLKQETINIFEPNRQQPATSTPQPTS